MAIFFDSTVGGDTANSYCTVAELNQYRENLGLAVLSDAAAQVALIKATLWLENQYRLLWNTQNKTTSTQALHFPQTGAYDYSETLISSDVIPDQIKKAVYEYSIRSSGQSSLDPAQKTNVKMQELSGLGTQEFFGKNVDGSLPDDFKFIDSILSGLIKGRSGTLRILDLSRYA